MDVRDHGTARRFGEVLIPPKDLDQMIDVLAPQSRAVPIVVGLSRGVWRALDGASRQGPPIQ
jgi:hypothetical protein